MEASLAATGMLDVLATKAVLFMMLSTFPSTSMVSYMARELSITLQLYHFAVGTMTVLLTSGKSRSTSDISLPRSPQPT